MAKLVKTHVDVKLDDYLPGHYPDVVVKLWTNFPRSLLREFMALQGEDGIADFLSERGIILSHGLENEDSQAVPSDDLPWPIYSVLTRALIAELTRIRDAAAKVFSKPESTEAPKSEE